MVGVIFVVIIIIIIIVVIYVTGRRDFIAEVSGHISQIFL
jgi:hypothetical protein